MEGSASELGQDVIGRRLEKRGFPMCGDADAGLTTCGRGQEACGEHKKTRAEKLYDRFKEHAEYWKVAGQMWIGVAIPVLLMSKLVLLISQWRPKFIPGEFIDAPILEVVGGALMMSTGLELAYMLFTPGPDEAVEPLILGLSATALIIASRPNFAPSEAIIILSVSLTIALLFWVREKYIPEGARHGRATPKNRIKYYLKKFLRI